ncbi:hypothetical protein GH714_022107 [Hevea brasiliensis]|uniref:Inhibitor of growth protein N-terminal histone-binding domain-containing protein n=1 Tax=Hevea brasiliensis TaxID=3981 RepID=A0A6A6MQA6_HEVBR|nr:hypothetical protein GH714_022107 [Hevea brasiliensis]
MLILTNTCMHLAWLLECSRLDSGSLDRSADLESLPIILQKKYALLRDLDKSLREIQSQNEQLCEQEIKDIQRGVKAGNITADTLLIRFSDEALDEQKHSIRIADEKVALAVQAYDLVDAHIQQLDQYLKKFDEELRRERESVAATTLPGSSLDGSAKSGRGSGGGRGGRKKYPISSNFAILMSLLITRHALSGLSI